MLQVPLTSLILETITFDFRLSEKDKFIVVFVQTICYFNVFGKPA